MKSGRELMVWNEKLMGRKRRKEVEEKNKECKRNYEEDVSEQMTERVGSIAACGHIRFWQVIYAWFNMHLRHVQTTPKKRHHWRAELLHLELEEESALTPHKNTHTTRMPWLAEVRKSSQRFYFYRLTVTTKNLTDKKKRSKEEDDMIVH